MEQNQFLGEELNKVQRIVKSKGIYIAMAATIVGLFIGIPTLFWLAGITRISVAFLMLLIFICGGLGLLQWKYVYRFLDMNYHQFAMYAYSGFGMCLINFLLLLNLFVPISNHTETYAVKHIGIYNGKFQINLGDEIPQSIADNISEVATREFEYLPNIKFVTVKYNIGILGFDTFSDCCFR